MNGQEIKQLMASHGVELNAHKYFDNSVLYHVNDIPNINIDKKLLENKLCHKLGDCVGKYVMERVFAQESGKVNPFKILELAKI